MPPWLSWIVLGLIAGSLAKFVVPGRDLPGCLITVLLGIAGATVSGLVGAAVGITSSPGGALDLHSILVATLGAVVVLVTLRFIVHRMPWAARRRPGSRPHPPPGADDPPAG